MKCDFLHEGAPIHHITPIYNYRNNEYLPRWIGRGGPFNTPPRFPCLTKIEFYEIPSTTREDMKVTIRLALRNLKILQFKIQPYILYYIYTVSKIKMSCQWDFRNHKR